MRSSRSSWLANTSVIALSAVGAIALAQPAQAQDTTLGIYAGGSTLASLVFRQLFDCYAGKTVGGDGYTFATATTFSTSPPSLGLLPADCTTWSTVPTHVEGLYAAVDLGRGGYISNNPDQWYGGLPPTGYIVGALTTTPFPASLPPFLDSSNSSNFGVYPYPQVDIGVSDSPLVVTISGSRTNIITSIPITHFTFTPTTNWSTTGGSITQVFVDALSQVTYNTTNFGQPIQMPAFEAGVAIAINTASNPAAGITWTINSIRGAPAPGVNGAGAAIQLTEAQLCAIFSGLVSDWSSTQPIAYMNSNGAVMTAPFYYANTINGAGRNHGAGAVPYVNTPLPITVVYPLDESGEAFILTNFLQNYCPLLDTGAGSAANGYAAIFGHTNLPTSHFIVLIKDIGIYEPPAGAPSHTNRHFEYEIGSGGVAAAISTSPANTGFIGFVGADFTFPYAQTVSGAGLTNVAAPLSASIQNENERVNGAVVPGGSSVDSGNFIAPTPVSVDGAWQDPFLTAPPAITTTTTPFYPQWNVYGQIYPAGTVHGGVNVGGKSVLALTSNAGAYPLAGTTFLDVYSCYATSTRAGNVVNFLQWLYGPTGTPSSDVLNILENNSFHVLNAGWGNSLYGTYLSPTSANRISSAGAGGGCPAGASGAN